ncbi:MAG: acylphosphatase [Deltaproteobacteria bacterium]|nr:acylphosphatase [Deltaproteobacteria bacterium]
MVEVKRVHLLISGCVQGVFFRANAKKMADLFRLKGWVKNLATGQVELYAIGPEEQLKKIIEWSHHGPPRAHVTKVDILWDKNLGNAHSFEVI